VPAGNNGYKQAAEKAASPYPQPLQASVSTLLK